MRLFLFLAIATLCFSCKQEINTNTNQEVVAVQLDSLSKQQISLDLLKLSSQAEKDLESFEDFHNLRNLAKTLHTSNSFYVRKYADSVEVLIQTFEENLTEDLKVNPINSRITILLTESGLLRQESAKKNPDSVKIMNANRQFLKAYNSLIIQLNELSLAIPENIEKELLRDLGDDKNE
ncbi:hypothetical protein M0D21_16175 [Aquimarina sp. D1M17]|uniref:hypothetical protein n=1 Tax=Aquimarina acroporae TaxID=2937283 RepID=UPI0020BFF368|nr:hypothetical protein [Aquimarina acroporae]MCK8523116.1 hypothetical protein [Aquimarina acroporae]